MSADKSTPRPPIAPTPWRVQGETIVDANGRGIGVMTSVHNTVAEDGEVAGLVVRAVNSYDAMREALLHILDTFDTEAAYLAATAYVAKEDARRRRMEMRGRAFTKSNQTRQV